MKCNEKRAKISTEHYQTVRKHHNCLKSYNLSPKRKTKRKKFFKKNKDGKNFKFDKFYKLLKSKKLNEPKFIHIHTSTHTT